MIVKIASAIIALVLVAAFVLPVAIKLKDPAMIAVISLGYVCMLVDLWQSLRERE